MNSLSTIRNIWLNYFKSQGFKIISSAPLIHPSFPMSFNMSAGLVQIDPRIRSKFKIEPIKECLIQKCFRHFDIDKVGDGKHLSFFEMAGAFEILKYNKIKTISHIWNFLTKGLALNTEKIWITTVKNIKVEDKSLSVENSLLSHLRELVGERVIVGDETTNLWKQGGGIKFEDNKRLCGHQVEFFYQIASNITSKENPLTKPDKFLEISNIIFIEYYIDFIRNSLNKLKNKAAESVIGIERVASILDGQKITVSSKVDKEYAILDDHLKSLLFIFSEEVVLPGKSGRNRIIRTLIRNILTICYLLDVDQDELFNQILTKHTSQYMNVYPEIIKGKNKVITIISNHNIAS